MTFTQLLAQTMPADLTSLGTAGLMGAMWLWERNTSRTREEQLNAVHERVMADRIQLDALVDLVRQNTQALTRLGGLIDPAHSTHTPSTLTPSSRKENP